MVAAAGDPAIPLRLFADPARIERQFGWRASVTDLHTIIASAYAWFRGYPAGYRS